MNHFTSTTVVSVEWDGEATRVELSNGYVDVFDIPAQAVIDNPHSTPDQLIAAQAVQSYWKDRRERGDLPSST